MDRPRPVALDMPLDQLAAECTVGLLDAATAYARPALDDDAVAKASDLRPNSWAVESNFFNPWVASWSRLSFS